ncbi:MAG: trypsin-like peptidase domain-containing protein [Proteobacteria bacterium]|nr:trypsin-like peptidase domain-containing protein [Pseudomonadota bacterium]
MVIDRLRSRIAVAALALLPALAAAQNGLPQGAEAAARLQRELAVVVTIRTAVASPALPEGPEVPAGPAAPAGDSGAPQRRPLYAVASGFVVARNGYILTNAHVVADVTEAEVRLADGRMYTARVAGRDAATDVALLAVDADDLPAADIAEGGRVAVGEWVTAVGAPFGLERSTTAGIVSAWPRYLPGNGTLPLIQTEVPIHPGSSGSPLFNLRGQVVGMNSTIYTRTGAYAGVGFAIPIDVALRVAAPWRTGAAAPARSRIGLSVQPLSPELARAFGWQGNGALVNDVPEAGAAARAGLRNGDIVVGIGDRADADLGDLQAQISALPPGSSLTLEVFRRGALQLVALRTDAGTVPAEPAATSRGRADRFGLVLAELARDRRSGGALDAGLVVRTVGSVSQRAGLMPDDVIVAVGDRPVRTLADFDAAVQPRDGRPVACLVWRRGSYGYLALPSGR